MSGRYETTGGARVGWVNATWPFARLTATTDSLRVSVRVLGDYTFTPAQVTAITKHTSIPVLGWGIQIQHTVQEYPARLIFWSLGRPDALLAGIYEAGFQPRATESEVPLKSRGLPFRWGPIVGIIVMWNVLLMMDMFSRAHRPFPGPLTLLALGFVFASALAVLRVPAAHRFILKPGRSVGEIQPFLRLLLLVSGVMFVAFSFFVLLRH